MTSQLRKALTTTTDGAALVPYDLDPVLHEELLKLQPLAMLLDTVQARSKTHEYNVRSSHPLAWFEGEITPAQNQNSVYQRKTVSLKIQRIWGSVTGFAQNVDAAFINALEAELIGSLEGMSNILEFGILFGCANDIGFTGDAYQYSGILPRVYAYAPQNVIDAGGDKVTLTDLDDAIAKVNGWRGVRSDPKMWIMGQQMKLVTDGLQTRVQLPLRSAELYDGKITMDVYAGMPILESDYVVPAASTTSPAASLSGASTGGALASQAYNYRIASVTAYGEQVAGSAGTPYTVTVGDAGKITLSWTHDDNALQYMIFRQDGGSGDYHLLDIIAALTYNADGSKNSVVESYVDAGAKTPISTVHVLESGEQIIVLVNRNPARGVAFLGKVDDMGRTIDDMFNYVELARVKDTYDYMIKGYLAARLVYPNLIAVIRNVKLS